jgi:hypothetical protein
MTDKEILIKAWIKAKLSDSENVVYLEEALSHQMTLHKFAKAFWGENKVDDCGYKFEKLEHPMPNPMSFPKCWTYKAGKTYYTEEQIKFAEPAWRHHLRLIILEEEPIKYLEKFL